MRVIAVVLVLVALSGCSLLAPKDPAKAGFDLGPFGAGTYYVKQSSEVDVVVYEVDAPAWIDNSSMYYRLTYHSAAQPIPYAQSEWVMSPAALLTQRLRTRLSGSFVRELGVASANDAPRYTLRSELFTFEQVFDQPDHSRGVLRLQATLEGEDVRAQRTFAIEKPAPTADAAGGVSALSECADELASSIGDWVAENRVGAQKAIHTDSRAEHVSSTRMR